MRLLQLDDEDGRGFSLAEYIGCDIPPYAILSHTWGPNHEEVTYQDLLRGAGSAKTGYSKLTFCAGQAAKDNLRHFWVDTCCINKESSAELSESITSMFRWYHNSVKCYVYLADVRTRDQEAGSTERDYEWSLAFRISRWFSRGWTLQELLASPTVVFFSRDQEILGDKISLEQQIHEVTHLPKAVIRGAALADFDVDERISWISSRQTTREEDMAYSLSGILNVSMLPNYGEGKESAFKRLRREVKASLKDPEVTFLAKQRQKLLESLRFGQIDARQMTIKTAHSETCSWLLKNAEYLRWLEKDELNNHHGFFWIKGKPGTGKSTLMKFALDQAYKTTPEKVVISFFFNARGESLEKSTVGTYRSLLFQLLDRFPTLHCAFECLNLPKSEVTSELEWSVEVLQKVLENAIMLLKHYSVVCYIDALDECKDEQVRDMVRFFEHIGERTLSAGIDFRICFSSRYYPHITVRHAINLMLEGQQGHSRDIADYIRSELRIGCSAIATEIRKEIQLKASGVFMWVVLVVKILNKEYDRGRVHVLRRKLREIPDDLHDLFRDMLMRESHDHDELVLCIQWVLFAKRSLSPVELYSAVLSVVEPDTVSAWDEQEVEQDTIERFILDSSRGLTEIVPNDFLESRRVEFIHESVRDFLLNGDGLGTIWPDLQNNFTGRSHDRLRRCCLDYMITTQVTEPSVVALAPFMMYTTDGRQVVIRGFPLLQYAVDALLFHADAAEKNHVSQEAFFQTFSLAQWVRLISFVRNLASEYTEGVSLFYVLAHENMITLLQSYAPTSLGLEIEDECYGCPLFAAAANHNRDAVHEILGRYKNYGPSYETSVIQKHGETLLGCLSSKFAYNKERGVISYAAEFGITPIVTYLLKNSANAAVDARDDRGRTPLWWASSAGHADIVKLLCDTNGVDINSMNQYDGTPLYAAAASGHLSVVRLLLNRCAEVNIKGGKFGSPLLAVCAIKPPNLEVFRALLYSDATDVNIQAKGNMTPMLRAACTGQDAFIALLLDKGADMDLQDSSGYTPLMKAIEESHCDLARLLVARGANVNVQGGLYGNALQAASLLSPVDLVRLLIKAGADVNIPGGKYGNAIQAASSRYTSDPTASSDKAQIVQLLIDCGSDLNVKGGAFGTCLQAAVPSGSTAVLQMLIDHGANVNAKAGVNGTALQAASVDGHLEMARVLIEHGADVNAQGGKHGNALNAAMWYNRRGDKKNLIVDLLRKHGAIEHGARKRPHSCIL